MTDSYLEWQERDDMNPSWVLTLVTPGRDPIMLVCFDKPIEVRGSHETPACAVLRAAEELLEVLPVPNDFYGDESQALREALDNARKSSPETGASGE